VEVGTYEIVAVIRPDLDDEALGSAIERIHQRITEHGGTVTTTDRWGKRRLAYSIQKYRDGFYALIVFTLEPGRVAPLRQTLGLHEDLLRFAVAVHHPSPAPAAGAPQPAAGPPTPHPPMPQPAMPHPASPSALAPTAPSPNGKERPPVPPPTTPDV
jgi:small subunit ribosomal protein S6